MLSLAPSSTLTRAACRAGGGVVDRRFVDLDGRAPAAEILRDLFAHPLECGLGLTYRLLGLEERDPEHVAGRPVGEHEHAQGIRYVLPGRRTRGDRCEKLVDPARVALLERRDSCVHGASSVDSLEDTPVCEKRPPGLVIRW